MRPTTRRIVTLATCGAAFALPVIAGGTAQAAERNLVFGKSGSSVTIYGNDNGTATKLANSAGGATTGTTTTGYSHDLDSAAKTVLIAKLGTPSTYDDSSTWNYGSFTRTQVQTGHSSTGTVLALTKAGSTSIISKYSVVAGCRESGFKDVTNTGSGGFILEGLRPVIRSTTLVPSTTSTRSLITNTCYLNSTDGQYVAKGAAVAAGLPKTGSTSLRNRSSMNTYTSDGVVKYSYTWRNSSCQGFNTRC